MKARRGTQNAKHEERAVYATVLALALAACVPVSSPTVTQPTPGTQPAPTAQPAPMGEAASVVTADAFEDRYGIRVTLIGVTAAGGMVDFRFRVTDPGKARSWIEDLKLSPDLVVDEAGVTLEGPPEVEAGEIVADRVYWLLFPNSRGVVQPGTPVSVRLGDLQLDPVIAQ